MRRLTPGELHDLLDGSRRRWHRWAELFGWLAWMIVGAQADAKWWQMFGTFGDFMKFHKPPGYLEED